MKVFLTEKSVDGILSCLYYSFVEKIVPDILAEKQFYQPQLDALTINVPFNTQNIQRVKTAIFKYGGDDIIAHLKVCLLSCQEKAMTICFNYAYLTLKLKTDISNMLNKKEVSDFSFTLQKVLHEKHIMTGFIRFKESSHGVLYARYEPDNDITEILAPHFLKRLGSIPFIIHDGKRKKIAISNGKSIRIQPTNLPSNFQPSANEQAINDLWRKYFRTINIKERKNQSQQDRYFPRRYRKYCFETWE